MIAFLPVSRYRVEYQVASGRPYSVVERFLLESVANGTNRLDGLEDLLQIHRRVVIEGLVTLMQAGWLAMHVNPSAGEFVVTSTGKQALAVDDKLPSTTQLSNRPPAYIAMECVRGQVARGSAVRFRTRGELREVWEQGVLIPKSEIPYTVEPGLVRPLLWTDAEKGEYIRGVGPIDLVRAGGDYVVVEVDIINRRLLGIPTEWEADLLDELIDRANKKMKTLQTIGDKPDVRGLRKLIRVVEQPLTQSEEGIASHGVWSIPLDSAKLVSRSANHTQLLRDSLNRAHSCVVVLSPTLSLKEVRDLLPFVLAALQRGVSIDVCVGRKPTVGNTEYTEAMRFLGAMQDMAPSTASSGRLQMASSPSGSNACLLLSDPDGQFEAVVGSYSWLGGGGDEVHSVRLSHPGPVSRICSIATDVLVSDAHLRNSSNVIRLQNANAELEMAIVGESARIATDHGPLPASSTCQVRVLRDREHVHEFQAITLSTLERVSLSSAVAKGELSQPIATSLNNLLAAGRRVELTVGGRNPLPTAVAELQKRGATIRANPELVSNFVVADHHITLISSLAWLEEPRNEERPRNFELGVSIRSEQFGDQLLQTIASKHA